MKIAYAILIAFSLLFAGFCVFAAFEMPEYVYSSDDRAFEQFDRKREEVHLMVKAVSAVYFLTSFVVPLVGLILTRGRVALKSALGVVMGGSVLMLGWAFLLSGRISFDEVAAAWLAAPSVISGVCLWGLLSRPPAQNPSIPG